MYTNVKAYRDARDNIEHHFLKSNTVNPETESSTILISLILITKLNTQRISFRKKMCHSCRWFNKLLDGAYEMCNFISLFLRIVFLITLFELYKPSII